MEPFRTFRLKSKVLNHYVIMGFLFSENNFSFAGSGINSYLILILAFWFRLDFSKIIISAKAFRLHRASCNLFEGDI